MKFQLKKRKFELKGQSQVIKEVQLLKKDITRDWMNSDQNKLDENLHLNPNSQTQ